MRNELALLKVAHGVIIEVLGRVKASQRPGRGMHRNGTRRGGSRIVSLSKPHVCRQAEQVGEVCDAKLGTSLSG